MFRCHTQQLLLMRTQKHAESAISPRWVICIALLVLLGQLQGLVPLLFAGIAWLDGEHRVELDSGTAGYQLILKHDADAAPGSTFSSQHHHCAMDRLLVAFANSAQDKDTDHVFSFRNLDLADESKHLHVLNTYEIDCSYQPLIAFIAGDQEPTDRIHQRPHLSPVTRPPPSSAATAFIRQTVLTI
jgi:hypothetical protein